MTNQSTVTLAAHACRGLITPGLWECRPGYMASQNLAMVITRSHNPTMQILIAYNTLMECQMGQKYIVEAATKRD